MSPGGRSQKSEVGRTFVCFVSFCKDPPFIRVYSWFQLVAKVFKAYRDAEVAAAHELNHGLQVVFLFPRDANLSILQLALHLEPLRLDRLNDFLRLISLEALADFQFLPRMTN